MWLLGLLLAVNVLSPVASARRADDIGPRASTDGLTSTLPRPDTHERLFTEPAASVPASGLQHARQSRQSLAPAHPGALVLRTQGCLRPPRPVWGPVSPPWRRFYPRKLSPPSAEDEPALS